MKKKYFAPIAKKVVFDYEQIVVASKACSSGIWKEDGFVGCEEMTPGIALMSARAMPCGMQKFHD